MIRPIGGTFSFEENKAWTHVVVVYHLVFAANVTRSGVVGVGGAEGVSAGIRQNDMHLRLCCGYGDGADRAITDGSFAIQHLHRVRSMCLVPIGPINDCLIGVVVFTAERHTLLQCFKRGIAGIGNEDAILLHIVHAVAVSRTDRLAQ